MRVLVVGGSSSIGNTIVDAFVGEGVDVSATFNANRPAESRGAAWTRLDLSNPASIDALGASCGDVDVAVLMPSLSLGQTLAQYTDEQITAVGMVNFTGQVRLIQRIAPALNEGSQIIVMASLAGQRGSADPMYGATKGAMLALVKSLAKSMAPRTRVNAVAPGMVTETGMYDRTAESVIQGHLALNPLGSFISAADLAKVVVDLTRPHWQHLNGACIDMNGGQYVR